MGSTHCGRQAHLWHRHRAWQMRARKGLAPVTGSPASYRTTDLGGKVKKMRENPGMEGFKTGKVNNLSYQSEGFPRTGYFFPACVERWAAEVCQSCWDAAAAAVAVAVISPGSIFWGGKYAENRVVVKKIKE